MEAEVLLWFWAWQREYSQGMLSPKNLAKAIVTKPSKKGRTFVLYLLTFSDISIFCVRLFFWKSHLDYKVKLLKEMEVPWEGFFLLGALQIFGTISFVTKKWACENQRSSRWEKYESFSVWYVLSILVPFCRSFNILYYTILFVNLIISNAVRTFEIFILEFLVVHKSLHCGKYPFWRFKTSEFPLFMMKDIFPVKLWFIFSNSIKPTGKSFLSQ